MDHYEVEQPANGSQFSKLATAVSLGNHNTATQIIELQNNLPAAIYDLLITREDVKKTIRIMK